MKRFLPAGIALFLIVVSALVQGSWSERWIRFPELQVYADQLKNVPVDIGDWHSVPHEEPDERVREEAGAIGTLSRDFTRDDGQAVSVFIVTGRLQDMFYHEPKRCYKAAGFEAQEGKQRHEIAIGDGETADFFSSRFTKTDAMGKQDQVVYWSWDASGKWLAPTEHKWVFRGQHALYKLYVIFTPGPNDTADQNPAIEFIPQLIPALNKAFEKATDEAVRLTEENG
ncbi:MAG TPA: exosortase-associated EpsI family protein [Pirellulales bacterium]|nr:exosortase-associated EpsI family protein [Pirellulales bacterium]